MSEGACIIRGMTETWTKNTYACDPDECDTLIEITTSDKFGFPSGSVNNVTCPCGRTPNLLSVEPATITPINERKQMETTDTTDTTVSPSVDYNPDLLVTYKILNGYTDPEYATDKVRNIEWDLHNARNNSKTISSLRSKIDTVKDIISEAYADSDDQDTLRAIAEALDIPLTKEINWTATIEVSGTITIDLIEDCDFETEVYDNLYVDSSNGNIEINDTEVCNVREAY